MDDPSTEELTGRRSSRQVRLPPRVGWTGVGYVVVLLALLLLVLLPLVELARAAFDDGWPGVRAALSGTSGRAVVNTVWTSLVVTVLATVGGTAAALVTERSRAPGRRWLRAALVVSLVSAPLVSALGWVRAYGPSGVLDDAVGLHWAGLFGPAGIVVVGAAGAVPLAYLVVASALASRREADLERAARSAGAGPATVLRTVTLPLIRRAVGGAAALVLVSAVNAFEVPVVLGLPAGFPTMTTRLYQDLTLSADPAAFTAATVLATGLVVIAVLVVAPADIVSGLGSGRRTGMTAGAPSSVGRPSWWLAATVWAFLGITVAVPLVALLLVSLTRAVGLAPVPANWTLANFDAALDPTFWAALTTTAQLAAGAATATVALGGIAAALGTRRGGRALGTAVTATYAVAGSALAVAVLLAYGEHVRNGLVLILLAYLAKFWALGHRPLAGAAEQVPADLLRAARASGAGPGTVLRTVVEPLLRPAVAAAWLLVFLFAVHELTISSLLYGPGQETLAVVVLNHQELGDVGVTSALSVLLTLLMLAAGLLLLVARGAGRRRARP
jgi:iron(III) transport system permease protein